jgi:hypothetical protein
VRFELAPQGNAFEQAGLQEAPVKAAESEARAPRKRVKKSKGKGKGKGKTTGASARAGKCASRAPDGREICWLYNDPDSRCKRTKCQYAHICGICFGKHPLAFCGGNGQKGETQGSGDTG